MKPQAVLFDLDGTLVDTHPLIWRCLDETLGNRFGIGPSTELWKRSIGLPLEQLFDNASLQYGFTIADMAELVTEYRIRLHHYESEVTLFEGVYELIEELAAQSVRMGIVTTKYGEAARRHLQTTGLTKRFEVVVSGDQCENLKPHPEPFLRAMSAMGVSPDGTVGVGDSVGDIMAARAAGTMAVGALWGCEDIDKMISANPSKMISTPKEMIWW